MGHPHQCTNIPTAENVEEEDEDFIEIGPIHYWDMSIEHREEFENETWRCIFASAAVNVPDELRTQANGGSITLVGTGSRCVGQITIEGKCHIQSANNVFYYVADPVTKTFIKTIRPDASDLDVFLNNGIETKYTSLHIAEVLLYHARQGFAVVGVLYGHAAYRTAVQRTVDIARLEGIKTMVVPAPSIADNLMVDLSIQIGNFGLFSIDASKLLQQEIPMHPNCHTIISSVDDMTQLAEYLKKTYDDDECVTIHSPSLYPHCHAMINTLKIKNLQDQHLAKFNGKLTSVYIPPYTAQIGNSSQYDWKVKNDESASKNDQWTELYNDDVKNLLKNVDNWQISESYKYALKSELTQHITYLATDPESHSYIIDQSSEELNSELAKDLMQSQDHRITTYFMEHNVSCSALKSVVALMSSTRLRLAYLKNVVALDTSLASSCLFFMDKWLRDEALYSTPKDIGVKWNDAMENNIWMWAGKYRLDNGMIIKIEASPFYSTAEITFGAEKIINYSFGHSTLSWRTVGGNEDNADLVFSVDDSVQNEDVYPAITMSAYLWKGSDDRPAEPNAKGLFEGREGFLCEDRTKFSPLIPMKMLMNVQELWLKAKQSNMSYKEARMKDDVNEVKVLYDKYCEVQDDLNNQVNRLKMMEMEMTNHI